MINTHRRIMRYCIALLALLTTAQLAFSEELSSQDMDYRLSIQNNTHANFNALFYTTPQTNSGAITIASQQTADIRLDNTKILFVLLTQSTPFSSESLQTAEEVPIGISIQIDDTNTSHTLITGCNTDSHYSCYITSPILTVFTDTSNAQSTTLQSQTIIINDRPPHEDHSSEIETQTDDTPAPSSDNDDTLLDHHKKHNQDNEEDIHNIVPNPWDSSEPRDALEHIWKILTTGHN